MKAQHHDGKPVSLPSHKDPISISFLYFCGSAFFTWFINIIYAYFYFLLFLFLLMPMSRVFGLIRYSCRWASRLGGLKLNGPSRLASPYLKNLPNKQWKKIDFLFQDVFIEYLYRPSPIISSSHPKSTFVLISEKPIENEKLNECCRSTSNAEIFVLLLPPYSEKLTWVPSEYCSILLDIIRALIFELKDEGGNRIQIIPLDLSFTYLRSLMVYSSSKVSVEPSVLAHQPCTSILLRHYMGSLCKFYLLLGLSFILFGKKEIFILEPLTNMSQVESALTSRWYHLLCTFERNISSRIPRNLPSNDLEVLCRTLILQLALRAMNAVFSISMFLASSKLVKAFVFPYIPEYQKITYNNIYDIDAILSPLRRFDRSNFAR